MPESRLKQELLDILCCPKCRGDLQYNADENRLLCKHCGTVYPVKDGIPIMLTEEAASEHTFSAS